MAVIHEVAVKEGYEALFEVLVEALNQAQGGKGHERHAQDMPFLDQPIVRLGMMYGPGGPGQQVGKKTQEAMRLPHSRGIAEMLGAINYAAAMVIVSRRLGYNMDKEMEARHPVLTIKTSTDPDNARLPQETPL